MASDFSTLVWKIPWTEEPGKLRPWGCWGSDTTERLHFHFWLSCIGEGNGNPLQYSCLENPRDGEPGGLPSMGSHRVGHDWSDLAAAFLFLMAPISWGCAKTCRCSNGEGSQSAPRFRLFGIHTFRQQLLKYANTYSLQVEDSLAARARPSGGVPRVVVTKIGASDERLNSSPGGHQQGVARGESK